MLSVKQESFKSIFTKVSLAYIHENACHYTWHLLVINELNQILSMTGLMRVDSRGEKKNKHMSEHSKKVFALKTSKTSFKDFALEHGMHIQEILDV